MNNIKRKREAEIKILDKLVLAKTDLQKQILNFGFTENELCFLISDIKFVQEKDVKILFLNNLICCSYSWIDNNKLITLVNNLTEQQLLIIKKYYLTIGELMNIE